MIRFTYSIVLTLIAPILLYGLYKNKPGKPKFGKRWKEHFGITPSLKSNQPPIWIHAVSVGEVIAATPIILALQKKYPQRPILVTTTTSTGADQAMKISGIEHRYMPIDFSFAIRRFLQVTQPKEMLIMETELWPNTLHTVAKCHIPIKVLNARLSEKSYRNYKKIQPVFNLLAGHLSHIFCQYKQDAERFIKLGIDTNKVSITGSVKFDISITKETRFAAIELRKQLGTDRPIWIAASTHKGEDEILLAAHKIILSKHHKALLILVPRHPERFNSVFSLCETAGLSVIRRTENSILPNNQVYIGDTMGEMLTLLGASDICFMGGSLIGDKVGGHNMLEPIALGVSVLNGPSYFNFKEISEQLLKQKLMTICHSDEQIAHHVLIAFNTPSEEKTQQMKAFMQQHQGCINKILTQL